MDEKIHDETAELLGFVRQNAQMGVVTLERLAERLNAADRSMTDIITKQLNEYRAVADAATLRARELGDEPKDVCPLTRTAAVTMLDLQSIADRSPSHIAEMVIVGSTRGYISALRHIRRCPSASSDALGLAYRLLCTEYANIEGLKRYL